MSASVSNNKLCHGLTESGGAQFNINTVSLRVHAI